MELDIDQFGQLCNKMLFNTSLPTDLQASKSSFVLDKSDGSSAIMATSIGQGQTLVTPFHMALLVSAINNDGVLSEAICVRPCVRAATEHWSSSMSRKNTVPYDNG